MSKNGKGLSEYPFAPPTILDHGQMVDIKGIEHCVDVLVSDNLNTLWVNVDGVCRLRATGMAGHFIADIPKTTLKGS